MKIRLFVSSAAGALALAALWPQSQAVHAQPVSTAGTQAGALVRVVREVTERFRDVKAAEAEGYALAFGCVSGGEYGAMGLHYVNFPLVLDGVLDPARPEIVIYEPLPNGREKKTYGDFVDGMERDNWLNAEKSIEEWGLVDEVVRD